MNRINRILSMLKFRLVDQPLAYLWHHLLCRCGIHRKYVAMWILGKKRLERCMYCTWERSIETFTCRWFSCNEPATVVLDIDLGTGLILKSFFCQKHANAMMELTEKWKERRL